MNQKRGVIFTLSAVALAALVFFLTIPSEPRYDGKYLSDWLFIYRTGFGSVREWWSRSSYHSDIESKALRTRAKNAVQRIGTNALPCLVKWAGYQEPEWRTKLFFRIVRSKGLAAKLQRPEITRRLIPCRPNRPDSLAKTGFEILGQRAEPAVPELISMATQAASTNQAISAIHCLGNIGGLGWAALEAFSTNQTRPKWLREHAIQHLNFRRAKSQETTDHSLVSITY